MIWMNSHEHLLDLFAYNEWANARVAAALGEVDSPRSRQILSHIVTTENEYLQRFNGKDSTGFNFWPELTPDECADLNRQNAAHYRKLISEGGECGLDHVLNYKNSRG